MFLKNITQENQIYNNFLITSKNLFTAFEACSWAKKEEASKLILLLEKAFTQGISINVQNPEFMNFTILHYSEQKGFDEIVNFLLNKGANTNIKDNAGNTPLHNLANSLFFS